MAISTTQVPALGANYEIITATGTWTPPVGYSVFDVIILGAGGGGGGGAYADGSTATYAYGGGGGGSGYGLYFRGMRITAPVSVTIGTAGAGGNGSGPASGNGTIGARGGRTVFNGIVAPGGGAGRGGQATSSTTGLSSAGSNALSCYDEGIGTSAIYVPQARHAGGTNIMNEGGSGGSNGGNTSISATSSTVPIRTAGGSYNFLYSVGGIFGGCSSITASGSYRSWGSTDTRQGLTGVIGSLSQEFGPQSPYYNTTPDYYMTANAKLNYVGESWWIPGGGGAGYGVGGGATAGYGEAGYAGTTTSSGLHGYSTSATDTYRDAVAGTDYGVGGGGGGGVFNTGVRAGNGGAGGNGVVIVYWGM